MAEDIKNNVEPEADFPLDKISAETTPPTNPYPENRIRTAAERILTGAAVLSSAVVFGVGKANASPSETKPAATPTLAGNQHSGSAESLPSAEEGSVDAQKYTRAYFDGMRSGRVSFGYFNGTFVVDNQVKMYMYMDPDMKPYNKKGSVQLQWPRLQATDAYAKRSDSTRNKFGAGSRPMSLVDSRGNTWLCISMASINHIFGGAVQPSQLADQIDFGYLVFIPLKGNEGHIKLFEPGHGQPLFLAGAVKTYDNQTAQELGAGNLMITTPGFESVDSSAIAEWTTANKVKLNGNTVFSDGNAYDPAFVPLSQLKDYTTINGKPRKQYKMPSGKTVQKLINQAHPGYGG